MKQIVDDVRRVTEDVRRIVPIISTRLEVLAKVHSGDEFCQQVNKEWRAFFEPGPQNEVQIDGYELLTEKAREAFKLAERVWTLYIRLCWARPDLQPDES